MPTEYSYRQHLLQSRRVLVVEDEALIGMLLEAELLKAEADVIERALIVLTPAR
jgi:AmiR/NasT family two-component response regulator